ncbi:MAG: elongation factor Tu [Bacteroidetes bacterium]|nr:elongation factor Tu [Bacteroidota bacterium]
MKGPDFTAKLIYLKSEQGGRSTPVASGYRPQLKFDFTEMQTSGQQIFADRELVYPGDEVIANITMLSPHFYLGKLDRGTEFEFREGSRIIGTGKITEILNKDLKAQTS